MEQSISYEDDDRHRERDKAKEGQLHEKAAPIGYHETFATLYKGNYIQAITFQLMDQFVSRPIVRSTTITLTSLWSPRFLFVVVFFADGDPLYEIRCFYCDHLEIW